MLWCLTALGVCLPLSLAGVNAALAATTAALLLGLRDAKRGPILRRRLSALGREPVLLSALAYVLVSLISGLLGAGPRRSLMLWPKDLHKLWVLIVLGTTLGDHGRRRLTLGLALGAGAAALAGIGQSLFIDTGSDMYARAHGFAHPVVYGEMLGLCLLGTIFLYGRPEAGPAAGPRGRPFLTALACLIAAALVFNQTRAVLLAVLAGCLLASLADPRWRRRALAALAFGALILLLWEWLPTGGRTLESLLIGSAQTHGARWTLWDVAWRMFRDHPWTGVGPGHYLTFFGVYFQGRLDDERVWASAHNIILNQMAERGLLGLGALLAFLGSMTVAAWRRARSKKNGWTLWALSATGAFLVMNLTETAFQTQQAATLFLAVWTLGQARPGDEFL